MSKKKCPRCNGVGEVMYGGKYTPAFWKRCTLCRPNEEE